MTTAASIIDRAAELIGYKDPDEALGGNDAQNFLGVLNDMLDGWNTDRLYIVNTVEVVATVSGASATIGPGKTFNVTRPVRIEAGSFSRMNNFDYPLEFKTVEEWAAIPNKAVTGTFPIKARYDEALPTGTVYFWPVMTASVEIHLQVASQLTEFADLSTDYNLAQGYRKALQYSLAEELAPGRRPLDPKIAATAASARRRIKVVNFDSPQVNVGPNLSPYGRFVAGL